MKIETLKERLEKATAKLERKQGTIEKKKARADKKRAALAKMGYPGLTRETYFELPEDERNEDLYWTICDIEGLEDDIERAAGEIEETRKTIDKYTAQLAGEMEREEMFLKEIPEVFKNLQTELVTEWDAWDKARRDRLAEAYRELGYKGFFQKYNRADAEFRKMTDSEIHKANEEAAKALILDLFYRVRDVTGEVTNWSGLTPTVGTYGYTVLNGYVEGKEGRAMVESIYAGGYNIQRLHVRVLVKSV